LQAGIWSNAVTSFLFPIDGPINDDCRPLRPPLDTTKFNWRGASQRARTQSPAPSGAARADARWNRLRGLAMVRCSTPPSGKQDRKHRHAACVYRAEMDMDTMAWTRGRAFLISRLESRLKCPRCGSRIGG
jgi:hypothetical protein